MRPVAIALLGVLASGRLATGQGGWVAAPTEPTVGDTVWLERWVGAPPGWRVRAGKLEATEQVESLGEPSVLRAADGWVLRYPVVAWTPGAQRVTLPPIWRLGPDGRSDSLAGGTAAFAVRSVLPATGPRPEPKGALAPLRPGRRDVMPPLAAVALSAGLLAAALAWRRRSPPELPPPPHVPLDPEVPDARWLAAGEPKAVAARAAYQVRAAVARAVPEAHVALSTAECLAVVERLRSDAPVRELREVLERLDRVAFASAHGTDVAALAAWARALARPVAR